MKQLQGKVALVTGATRGIGRGIAIGLGEAGATVYITGRSLTPDDTSNEISGSLAETKLAVEQVGGVCIPLQVDHSDDEQVRLLFQRIETEQLGQLDLLVNNVYSGVPALRNAQGKPFWDCEPSLWDACNNVGLRSHYVASIYAAKIMTKRNSGLICTISSWGGVSYIFGAAYSAGKSACDRLAADMAYELKPYNIASISLYPGIVGTEHITSMAEQMDSTQLADPKNAVFRERYNWETPILTGRVIAQLASEKSLMDHTGRVQIVAELAQKYRLVDEGGTCPVSLRSLRFLIPYSLPQLRKYSWLIPDVKVPWWMLLISTLSAPKI